MKYYLKWLLLFIVSSLTLGNAYAERVIITFDSNGDSLKKGHQVKVQGENWFAVELDEHGKSTMRTQKGFKSMEVDPKRYLLSLYNDAAGDLTTQQLTPYAIYQSQANQLTFQPSSGLKVCIIDSGLDDSNPDFDWLSGSITGDNDSGTGDWKEHGGPHGTHVAGIVAANDNGFGVVGMAPGVPLHIIKVFNEDGWAYSSDLAHATDLCTAAGANIITMSLGGGRANSTEENAFNTFTDNNGLVLAAAGNDGNSNRTYPAGYKSVMMIGANDANNKIADFSQFPNTTVTTGRGKNRTTETDEGYGVEVTAGGVDTLSTYPAGLATLSTLTANGIGYPSAAMDNSDLASVSSEATYFMGTAEDIDAAADNKICVIDRGVISFYDKVVNCENSGGIGAIIINNVTGMLYGTLGDTNLPNIPAVGAALEDRAAITGSSTASISIVASDYGYMSGTSMATPAVAGIAALVWSNHPTCTGTEIRDALKATAEDQGVAGRDDYFGYGIAKAVDASINLASQGGCGNSSFVLANNAPTASFTVNCTTSLVCSFNGGTSSDSDGAVASYSWLFGDSSNATGITPSNTYSASGSYSVTLVVTDNNGATASITQEVTVDDGNQPPSSDITLTGNRSTDLRSITIDWGGANGVNVDVYVNGNLNNTTENDGTITYNNANKRRIYTFNVCEQGSTTACSNDLTI